MSINDHVYFGQSEQKLRDLIKLAAEGQPLPRQHADRSPLPWKIDPYEGKPPYDALKMFMEKRDADGVIKALKAADLRGMGGAGFRTHLKWSAVRGARGDVKYVVCNADESEPGTFKDRELLRRTPHLVIEGMILAGLVTGASKGTLYIRHEYEEEIEAVQEAIDAAQAQGVCGPNVLGSGIPSPSTFSSAPAATSRARRARCWRRWRTAAASRATSRPSRRRPACRQADRHQQCRDARLGAVHRAARRRVVSRPGNQRRARACGSSRSAAT